MNDRLIVALTVLAILLTPWIAHSQSQSSGSGGGYYISRDGTISSWDASGNGYSVGPSGTSSWNSQGGYVVSPYGNGSWSGPVDPVIPSEPPTFVIPSEPDGLPPLP
jgi:hypothetical protein